MLDHTKCPYCNSPTFITERPQVNGEDGSMLFPHEIVLTCSGEHKNLDIADWQEKEYKEKPKNKVINGIRRFKKFLD